MALLLVAPDEALVRRLAASFRAAGLGVFACGDPATALAAMRTSLPDTVVVDISSAGRSGLHLIRDVARKHPAARVPVVALTPAGPSQALRRVLAGLELHAHLPRETDPASLVKAVEEAVAARRASARPGSPDRYALDLLARLWAEEADGVLELPESDRRAALASGGFVDGDGIGVVEAALGGETLHFRPEPQEGLSDPYTLAMALWEAALSLAPGQLPLDQALVRTPRSARALDLLPICQPVAALLAPDAPFAPLGERLAEPPPDQAVRHAGALVLLGAARLLRRPQPRPARKEPDIESYLVLKRLQREAEQLAEAEDWTVLGIGRGSTPDEVREAGERMRRRYEALAADSQHPEYHDLALGIARRVEQAAQNLLALLEEQAAWPEGVGHDELAIHAFEKGHRAMREGQTALALRCFAAAREREPQSPQVLAWLGWATFHDPRRSGEARLKDALEYLRLADSLFPDNPRLWYFLARVEAEAGDLERAEERLSKLVRDGRGDKAVRALFLSVRKQRSAGAR